MSKPTFMGDLVAAHSAQLVLVDGNVPDWIQLMPFGTFAGRDGRGPYTLRDAAHAQQVIAASQAFWVGADMPTDYDHQLYRVHVEKTGGTAPASGHIKELAVRADGIWGRVEWTATATQRIAAKEYRYISPVFNHGVDGAVRSIWHASLTALPNLNLTALNSQGAPQAMSMTLEQLLAKLRTAMGLPATADADAICTHAQTLTGQVAAHSTQLATVAKALKLDEKAPAEQIATAAQQLSVANPDPAQYVAMSQYQKVSSQLAELQRVTKAEKAEAAVSAAMSDGKIAPAQKEWATAYASQDLDGFTKFVAGAPKIVDPGGSGGGGQPPAGDGQLGADEVAICSQLGLTVDEFKKAKEA